MDNRVSLGCGTLILIALIVVIFGNMGGHDASHQVNALQEQIAKLNLTVDKLQAKLDDQTKKLDLILSTINAQKAGQK